MPTWLQDQETVMNAPWLPDSWTLTCNARHRSRLDGMRLAHQEVDIFLAEESEPHKNAPAWKDETLLDGYAYADSYSEDMDELTKSVFMDAFIYALVQKLKNGKVN